MASITHNLFWGQGETTHQLNVESGAWPTDMDGFVFIVGPDKRRPGGHWFGEQGLLCRIDLRATRSGRIDVRHRIIDTPVQRIRKRLPWLFKRVQFMELSPFGLSNLANTGVQPLGDRLLVGYDAGRPIEVDPKSMRYLTAVGATDEWYAIGPGALEPPTSVAAHPAVDDETGEAWFVNYSALPVGREVYLAKWDGIGAVHRWQLTGLGEFDSIHDVKVCRDYVVFTDLPFKVEPGAFTGAPREIPNQDETNLWIVAKADVVAGGGPIAVTHLRIPMPTGHLAVDYEHEAGRIHVFCEHIPLGDLMMSVRQGDTDGDGRLIDPNFEGFPTLAVQPGCVGRYLIDVSSATVIESDLATDERVWGAVLTTRDVSSAEARREQTSMWYSTLGFDRSLIPAEWWRMYGAGQTHQLVAPSDLPIEPIPAALARFNLLSMKVEDVHVCEPGEFLHPPTFVPRVGADRPGDGYVVAIAHRDGSKAVKVFDAANIERGPIAVASHPEFNPPLLLHSCHMSSSAGTDRPDYHISVRRDLIGSLRLLPRLARTWIGLGPAFVKYAKEAQAQPTTEAKR